jgi:UDP-N-acetylmuramoyl-L-alanyl-D-glutamate--2,6-diaminopimelate ligase
MGAAAERHADRVVLTSDNPRSEDPHQIIEAIRAGMSEPDAATVVVDRRDAIQHALDASGPGDVIVVAGKGHETTQVIGDKTLEFDDRQVVRELAGQGEVS